MLPELSHDEIHRYSRHLLIPEVGLEGQKKLKAASILVIGTGGLGSPVALYLTAAGIGRIGLVDYDVVDYSNLQRQIIHGMSTLNNLKVESARQRMAGPAVHGRDCTISASCRRSDRFDHLHIGHHGITQGGDPHPWKPAGQHRFDSAVPESECR